MEASREQVTEHLGELQGWADFVCDALHAPLEHVAEPRALREVRELSWTLREKLYVLRTQVEFSSRLTHSFSAHTRDKERSG